MLEVTEFSIDFELVRHKYIKHAINEVYISFTQKEWTYTEWMISTLITQMVEWTNRNLKK